MERVPGGFVFVRSAGHAWAAVRGSSDEFAGKLPTLCLFAMDHPKVVYDDDARPSWRLLRDRQGDL